MPKFFVGENQIKDNSIVIVGEDVNHIINVLRMKKNDEIQICNQYTGENYLAKIFESTKNEVKCEIIEKLESTAESNVNITLFQGIPKFEKMELIIQKNTEVGIKKIVPVMMERTIVKLDDKVVSKKIERWQKIAEIAAKQSMRDTIPHIDNVIKTKEIENYITNYDSIIVAYENEQKNTLKNVLKHIKEENIKKNQTDNDNDSKTTYDIAIVIGPEGGISEKEIEILKKCNAQFITLGKRILRTETAGLVMAGNIIYELED